MFLTISYHGETTQYVPHHHMQEKTFVKAFHLLSKKAIHIKPPTLFRSFSYHAINVVLPHVPSPRHKLPKVDPKLLSDMLGHKRPDSLNQSGDVKELPAHLETDLKRGISDDNDDIDRRKRVFGVNVFTKPPSKGLFPLSLKLLRIPLSSSFGLCCAFPWLWNQATWVEGRVFEKLSAKSGIIGVEVVRGDRCQSVSISEVADGFAYMLVTSVGMNTAWGVKMATLVLVVSMVRYFMGSTRDEFGNREFVGRKRKSDDVMSAVVGIVAAAVTIVVVDIPEGLSLAVTLTWLIP
ncbi:hypothetical protein VNO80_12073 [Phaseolus coccineus]|uniref:Cation-transporting P-type ATPase N-terminal domain-containing protein n=1 Tax=Phaseolus coccineus TaxID=3886 RepID=A0AAN9RFL1_PHACN